MISGALERPCGFLARHEQSPTALGISSSRDLYFITMIGWLNQQYTVPAGKTLWVTQWNAGYGFTGVTAKPDYCRLFTHANQYSSPDNSINFRTVQSSGVNIWYPYSEMLLSQSTQSIIFEEPTKLSQKVTLKVAGYASAAGFVTSVLRGYITTP